MNWADRANQTCVRDNPLVPWEITKQLRRQKYVGLAVIVGKALDLRMNIPATNDDNDDDRWSTTETVGVRATREMATETKMEEVHLNPVFRFHCGQGIPGSSVLPPSWFPLPFLWSRAHPLFLWYSTDHHHRWLR